MAGELKAKVFFSPLVSRPPLGQNDPLVVWRTQVPQGT
jgi:hypothetical protein